MDCGSVLGGIVQCGSKTVARGVCVKLGGAGNMSACFNTDTLAYEAVWAGRLYQFSAVRHGFVDALTPDGRNVEFTATPSPAGTRRYRGYYRSGTQVVFAYEIDGRMYFDRRGSRMASFRT